MRIENGVVFGRTYRDVITRFEGIATGFACYLTGCDSVLLAPRAEHEEGKISGPRIKRRDGEWFDIDRLVHVPTTEDVALPAALGGGGGRQGLDDDGHSEVDKPDDAPPERSPYFGLSVGADALPPRDKRRD